MPDRIFYVGAVNGKKEFTGFVPARFLTINGQPVVDPISRRSQDFFIYSDDQGSDKTHARIANPNCGEPASVGQIADYFALHGLTKRAAALENLDNELRGGIDSGPHSLRRRVQLMVLRRKMGGVHEALRKARR